MADASEAGSLGSGVGEVSVAGAASPEPLLPAVAGPDADAGGDPDGDKAPDGGASPMADPVDNRDAPKSDDGVVDALTTTSDRLVENDSAPPEKSGSEGADPGAAVDGATAADTGGETKSDSPDAPENPQPSKSAPEVPESVEKGAGRSQRPALRSIARVARLVGAQRAAAIRRRQNDAKGRLRLSAATDVLVALTGIDLQGVTLAADRRGNAAVVERGPPGWPRPGITKGDDVVVQVDGVDVSEMPHAEVLEMLPRGSGVLSRRSVMVTFRLAEVHYGVTSAEAEGLVSEEDGSLRGPMRVRTSGLIRTWIRRYFVLDRDLMVLRRFHNVEEYEAFRAGGPGAKKPRDLPLARITQIGERVPKASEAAGMKFDVTGSIGAGASRKKGSKKYRYKTESQVATRAWVSRIAELSGQTNIPGSRLAAGRSRRGSLHELEAIKHWDLTGAAHDSDDDDGGGEPDSDDERSPRKDSDVAPWSRDGGGSVRSVPAEAADSAAVPTAAAASPPSPPQAAAGGSEDGNGEGGGGSGGGDTEGKGAEGSAAASAAEAAAVQRRRPGRSSRRSMSPRRLERSGSAHKRSKSASRAGEEHATKPVEDLVRLRKIVVSKGYVALYKEQMLVLRVPVPKISSMDSDKPLQSVLPTLGVRLERRGGKLFVTKLGVPPTPGHQSVQLEAVQVKRASPAATSGAMSGMTLRQITRKIRRGDVETAATVAAVARAVDRRQRVESAEDAESMTRAERSGSASSNDAGSATGSATGEGDPLLSPSRTPKFKSSFRLKGTDIVLDDTEPAASPASSGGRRKSRRTPKSRSGRKSQRAPTRTPGSGGSPFSPTKSHTKVVTLGDALEASPLPFMKPHLEKLAIPLDSLGLQDDVKSPRKVRGKKHAAAAGSPRTPTRKSTPGSGKKRHRRLKSGSGKKPKPHAAHPTGLHVGDVLLWINNVSVEGMAPDELRQRLHPERMRKGIFLVVARPVAVIPPEHLEESFRAFGLTSLTASGLLPASKGDRRNKDLRMAIDSAASPGAEAGGAGESTSGGKSGSASKRTTKKKKT